MEAVTLAAASNGSKKDRMDRIISWWIEFQSPAFSQAEFTAAASR
jgi:hypothetical protein